MATDSDPAVQAGGPDPAVEQWRSSGLDLGLGGRGLADVEGAALATVREGLGDKEGDKKGLDDRNSGGAHQVVEGHEERETRMVDDLGVSF